MMSDTEMPDQARLPDGGENGGENSHTVTQSLFDAVFMTKYLIEEQKQPQKSFVTSKLRATNSGA